MHSFGRGVLWMECGTDIIVQRNIGFNALKNRNGSGESNKYQKKVKRKTQNKIIAKHFPFVCLAALKKQLLKMETF